jgi:hypothetical protein
MIVVPLLSLVAATVSVGARGGAEEAAGKPHVAFWCVCSCGG